MSRVESPPEITRWNQLGGYADDKEQAFATPHRGYQRLDSIPSMSPSAEGDPAMHFTMAGQHLVAAVRGLGVASYRMLCCACRPSSTVEAASEQKDKQDDIPVGQTDPEESGMILPTYAWKERWDILIMFLILYSAVAVPIRVCFDAEAEGLVWRIEASMSIFFIIDLAMGFRTAFHEDGVWITDHKRIAGRYLSGWFWIDGPSSLPVELLTLYITRFFPDLDASGMAGLRFLRMFRLIRLLRLLKVDQYVSQAEEAMNINLRALRLVRAPPPP